MELLSSGVTSNQIRRHLRTFQCAFLPQLGYEHFEIPEERLWSMIRERMTAAAQGMRLASAESDAQTGYDESEIDRVKTLNVSSRPIDASGQSYDLLLAACHVQPGATAEMVSAGITGVYT